MAPHVLFFGHGRKHVRGPICRACLEPVSLDAWLDEEPCSADRLISRTEVDLLQAFVFALDTVEGVKPSELWERMKESA